MIKITKVMLTKTNHGITIGLKRTSGTFNYRGGVVFNDTGGMVKTEAIK